MMRIAHSIVSRRKPAARGRLPLPAFSFARTPRSMQAARFIHGNRLEVLADRLIDDQQAHAASDPLKPQVIVVAHPALGRWLQERMADQLGIAINIEFPLPSTFAWRVLRTLMPGLPRDSAFSRAALVWRIHALLPELSTRAGFEPVRRYLGDRSDARRRYDLALALARAYDEYMVARPQWIRAWARGQRVLDDDDERWQAALWRALVQGTDEPDRATLMQDALTRFASMPDVADALPKNVAVFGASFLPPLLLEFYMALAARLPLRFYQPNPCLDYWGDIVSERELARRRGLWMQHGRRDTDDYYEVGHPLLASWGTLGREHLKAIHTPETVVHDDDAFASPPSTHLLGWLQQGILLLDPAHAPPPSQTPPTIQLHGCPGRRREIEVLRDELLRLIEADATLKPHDVVVMSPRLDEYVAYIDAVFGDADDALALPYSVGDIALRATHPLLDAFMRVLDLGNSRFTASEVVGLLAEPSISRRYTLDADALAWIRTWIEESGIRWGLDADFRAALGAAALAENTWRFGLDRLLLGYALGDEQSMAGDVVPAANVEGHAAQALGQLAHFVAGLAATRSAFSIARPAAAWKQWLLERVDALFDGDTDDAAEIVALASLRATIATFGNEAASWLADEMLPFEVVRSALLEALEAPHAARTGRFGIRFCGMVPMRNVPYRVVCVLGLNAGEFPRRQPPPGFQLMRRHPRAGDRSVREDDRFLFLESVVAARDVLYLSYVDRDVRAGSVSPPSPLVEELLGFLREQYGAQAWKQIEPMIVRHHALHAFASDYFTVDESRHSYDARWWNAAKALAGTWQPARPFVDVITQADAARTRGSSEAESIIAIDIARLLAWLRHPARSYFASALPLRPPDQHSFEDGEPFVVDPLARFGFAERLLGEDAKRPDLHRLRGEGTFPLGAAGDLAWTALNERTAAIEAATFELLGVDARRLVIDAQARDVPSASARLHGIPRLLFAGASQALLLRRPARIRAVDLVHLALERELLEAHEPPLRAFVIGWQDGTVVSELGALAAPETWLADLVAAYREGLRRPLPLFRESSGAYAAALVRGERKGSTEDAVVKAFTAAQAAWEKAGWAERDDPFNALIARHRDDVLGAEFAALAERLYVPVYDAFDELPR